VFDPSPGKKRLNLPLSAARVHGTLVAVLGGLLPVFSTDVLMVVVSVPPGVLTSRFTVSLASSEQPESPRQIPAMMALAIETLISFRIVVPQSPC
jgi:hypothetical protein